MNIDKIPNPCIDCMRREIGCHGVCAEYADYKRKIEEMRSAIKKDKTVDQMVSDYEIKRAIKISRKLKWEKGRN